jgi:hypothetical protein
MLKGKFFKALPSALLALTAACTSSNSTPAGTASMGSASVDSLGNYTVVFNETSISLGQPSYANSTVEGQRLQWGGASVGDDSAGALTSPDVLAVAGVYGGSNFYAGLSGNLTANVQTSGTASYTPDMRIFNISRNGSSSALGFANISVDFGAGTLATTGFNPLSVDMVATISGASFDGTATYRGVTAPLEGGFYGPNASIAGVFAGQGFAGVFQGPMQ